MQTSVLTMTRSSRHHLIILLACGIGKLEKNYSASEGTRQQVMNGQCAVQENIHTHHMEGHWKLLGEGGLTSQILDAKYEAKLKFPGGTGVQNKKKNLPLGGVWIFSGTAQCNISL